MLSAENDCLELLVSAAHQNTTTPTLFSCKQLLPSDIQLICGAGYVSTYNRVIKILISEFSTAKLSGLGVRKIP